MTPVEGTKVIGYVRVSTNDQAENGAGLEAQRRAITDEAERRGWELVTICEDGGVSGKTTNGRKALAAATTMLEAHQADVLVAAKLDRLTRSLVDFAALMERARQQGWAIVVLDAQFDMTTPVGELMANMLASFAQFERRIIGQRTKEALAVKRSQGVKLGRPTIIEAKLVSRIRRLHDDGASLGAIARQLNDDAVPTAHGGKRWYPSTVSAVLGRTT